MFSAKNSKMRNIFLSIAHAWQSTESNWHRPKDLTCHHVINTVFVQQHSWFQWQGGCNAYDSKWEQTCQTVISPSSICKILHARMHNCIIAYAGVCLQLSMEQLLSLLFSLDLLRMHWILKHLAMQRDDWTSLKHNSDHIRGFNLSRVVKRFNKKTGKVWENSTLFSAGYVELSMQSF